VSLVYLTEVEALPYVERKKVVLEIEKIVNDARAQRTLLLTEAKRLTDKSSQGLVFNEIERWSEFISRVQAKTSNAETVLSGKTEFSLLVSSTTTLLTVVRNRKTTLFCVKGSSTKKVVAVNPKCPKGFKPKR
jgi:hypothetical protein